MKGRILVAIALFVVHPAKSDARGHRLEPTAPVTVRVYRSTGEPAPFEAVGRRADRLFRAAGITVTWVECAAMPDACRAQLQPTELILRLAPATDASATAKDRSLGFAFVDPQARTSRVASVYPERVAILARLARVDETELLARAVAHEVGHLLIQSNQHARGGLMRANWTVEELQLNRPRDWSFSDTERQVMHRAVVVAAAVREPEAVSTRNSAAGLGELR